MGGLLSSQKKAKQKALKHKGTVSATDRAVLDLKNARDRLSRYRTKLNEDEKKLLIRAKNLHIEGQTNMALKLMQLRKHKLKEAENTEEQLLNVLKMVQTIISKESEQAVLKSLATGKNALEALHKEMTVDDVLKLLDEVKEQNEIESEINSILRDGLALSAVDEMEIEKELEAMMHAGKPEARSTEAEQTQINNIDILLPEAPTTKLPDSPQPQPQKPPQKHLQQPVAS
jgi:charged multivesicular body protein 6